MTFAYLCHSSSDKQIVDKLAEKLGKDNVFYDKWDLNAGDLIPSKLSDAVYESKWFVIIASKEAMISRWVKFELNIALRKWIEDENYRIIVAKIDDCEIQHELTAFLYINSPNNPDKAIDEIVEIIRSEGKDVLGPRTEWRREIVGRFTEMEAIEKLSYEGIRFIFLWGHYGIGKSTLAENVGKQVFRSRISRFPLTVGHDLLRLSLELAARAKLQLPPPMASDDDLLSFVKESIDQLIRQGNLIFFDEVQLAFNDDGTPRDYLASILETISDLEDIPPVLLATNHYPQLSDRLKEESHILKVGPLKDEHMLFCLERWIQLSSPNVSMPERSSLNKVVEHLYGYPLAARFASYLIIKYSVDTVLGDIQHFKDLRVDIAKQLLGRTKLKMSPPETKCLEALTLADTGLSLNELSEVIETDIEEIRNAVNNLNSALLITVERGRLQIIPIAKDYFWSRTFLSNKNWKDLADKLAEMARLELTQVSYNSDDYVLYCSRAYRLLILVGRLDDANELAYYFKGELKGAATRLYHAKEYETSLKYADLWLEINPNDYSLKLLRARCLTRLERISKAEEVLKELEKTKFSKHKIYHGWGLLQRQTGDIKKAVLSFKKGLDYRPDNLPLLRDYGDALWKLGDLKGAIRNLNQAYDIAPRDPYIVDKLVYFLEKDGQINKALSFIKGFVDAYPEEASFQHRISMLYGELGNHEKEYYHARNAIDLDLSLDEAVMHLAAIENKRGDLDEASRLLDLLPKKLSFQKSRIRDTVLAELALKGNDYGKARNLINRYEIEKDPYCANVMGRIELSEVSHMISKGHTQMAKEQLARGKNSIQKASNRYPENHPLKLILNQIEELEGKLNLY